jgi:hypothetical protein
VANLDDWESLLRKLIELPVTEAHLERGREIKEILTDLSRYPFDPVCRIKNIKEDRDLARDEGSSAKVYLRKLSRLHFLLVFLS